jgi:hypothetical protein
MDNRRRRSYVGKVADNAQDKGWFFGHFMPEPLLRSEQVEVAWQSIPNLRPSLQDEHVEDQADLRRDGTACRVVLDPLSAVPMDIRHRSRGASFPIISWYAISHGDHA